MNGKDLLNLLNDGKKIYGTAVVSSSPMWPFAVKQTGLDFVFLDTEHTPIDRTILAGMCQMYKALGIPPLVRIPSPDPYEACKVLDGGAAGVIAPYIETVEQVKSLVGATKLRPLKGKKLEEALEDPDALELKLKQYLKDRNANNVLIANIESVPAMDNLDELLAVPGLDAVIIGPHDLSCSLGLPEEYYNPNFEKELQKIITKIRASGKGVGVHFSEGPDLQIKWAKAGVNIIMHSSDISLFGQALQQDIREIKTALGGKKSGKDKYRGEII